MNAQLAMDFTAPPIRYPNYAGSKQRGETSEAAADDIEAKGRAEHLRQRVLAHFAYGYQSTADEVADHLGESILSIRPRCSELRKQRKLVPTGDRRPSSTGKSSQVLKLNQGTL